MSMYRRVVAKLRWELKKRLRVRASDLGITLGRGSYIIGRPKVLFGGQHEVRVGNHCSISHGVEFLLGGDHRTDWVTTSPIRLLYKMEGAGADGHPRSKGDIVIDNDVWLGRDVKVLSGVTIGNGAVIAAYSVVTKDVPPYGIVAGQPATLRRFRFPEETRHELQRIAWWNWSEALIRERVADLCSPDVGAFIDKYGRLSSDRPDVTDL